MLFININIDIIIRRKHIISNDKIGCKEKQKDYKEYKQRKKIQKQGIQKKII